MAISSSDPTKYLEITKRETKDAMFISIPEDVAVLAEMMMMLTSLLQNHATMSVTL